jgi:hypothetical protein
MAPDLNTVSLTSRVVKPPDFQQPWTFVELRVDQPDGCVLFISAHVPCPAYLHLLEDLSVGDRLYVAGALALSRSSHLPGRSATISR